MPVVINNRMESPTTDAQGFPLALVCEVVVSVKFFAIV